MLNKELAQKDSEINQLKRELIDYSNARAKVDTNVEAARKAYKEDEEKKRKKEEEAKRPNSQSKDRL